MAQINTRVLINGSKGMVKYIGPLEGATGIWIGIDWDNKDRGKHDGTYKGKYYFTTSFKTSGSFMREQNLDFGTELFAEIVQKYASELQVENNNCEQSEGIQWEFVDMNKIFLKQKEIFRLKCIVLSSSKVSHINVENIHSNSFKFCTELDLSDTLISKWCRILSIFSVFPVLKILHLNNNRIEPLEECTENEIDEIYRNLASFNRITHISLNRCQLTKYTTNQILHIFSNLEELYLAQNQLTHFSPSSEAPHLRLLDLQENPIADIARIKSIYNMPCLDYLNLSSCQIKNISFGEETEKCFQNLKTLILQDNPITQWKAIEELECLPSLKKLILKGTFLSGARGVDSREMIIAKIPQIVDLDRCDISPVARRSGELLFLSRFSQPPIEDEHRRTLERLRSIYDTSDDQESGNEKACENEKISTGIKSKRIFLAHGHKTLERTLSLALPIHKIVGLGARLFNFSPDQLSGVEMRRSDPNYPPETLSRTKDNLLRQFGLEDGDTIAFI